jgi:hypothetical protein
VQDGIECEKLYHGWIVTCSRLKSVFMSFVLLMLQELVRGGTTEVLIARPAEYSGLFRLEIRRTLGTLLWRDRSPLIFHLVLDITTPGKSVRH